MKKNLIFGIYFIIMLILVSCGKKETITSTTAKNSDISKETKPTEENDNITENFLYEEVDYEENIDSIKKDDITDISKNLFHYTGNDKYLKPITDYLIKQEYFFSESTIFIPSPNIIKYDESDLNDIKIYGDFWIYGYVLVGDTLHNDKGGSFPGCMHLSNKNEEINVVSFDIAEDGSNFDESIKKICNNDKELYEKMFEAMDSTTDESINIRKEYIKMYRDEYDLDIKYYKDYGWRRVSIDGEISQDEDNFYDAKETIDFVLQDEGFDGITVRENYLKRVVSVELWKDGLSKIITDDNYELKPLWDELKFSLINTCTSITDIFESFNVPNVTIIIKLLEDENYNKNLLVIENNVIKYDILNE